MCQQHDAGYTVESSLQGQAPNNGNNADSGQQEPFPWDVGVFDAHCHPTDTMSSVDSVPRMKARALTVMSTRSQDQGLVSTVAQELEITGGKSLFTPQAPPSKRIIPSFGWHPWFSHQLYDDSASVPTYDGSDQGKLSHYDKILQPSPSSKDPVFSKGLPAPRPLSNLISETRERLERHPFAVVGEVGLDKAFRLPENWASGEPTQRDNGLTPGGREDRRLSPHRVSIDHQITVLKAQLRLAGEMNRAVSVHGVQVHGGVYNAIADCWNGHEKEVLSRRQQRKVADNAENFSNSSEDVNDVQDLGKKTEQLDLKCETLQVSRSRRGPKPYPPRICLHSYSGPVNILQQYLHPSVPAKVFFSFSIAVNWGVGGKEKTEEAIRAVPDNRILVESDLHVAGNEMDTALEQVCREVCRIKGWQLRNGVEKLASNWREYIFDDINDGAR